MSLFVNLVLDIWEKSWRKEGKKCTRREKESEGDKMMMMIINMG